MWHSENPFHGWRDVERWIEVDGGKMDTGMDVWMSRWVLIGKQLDRQLGRNIGRWLKIYKHLNECREA